MPFQHEIVVGQEYEITRTEGELQDLLFDIDSITAYQDEALF